MSFQITRNASIELPPLLQSTLNPEVHDAESKRLGISKCIRTTINVLPFPSFAVLAGISVFHPVLGSVGLSAGTFGYTALVIGSGIGVASSIIPFFSTLTWKRRKANPGSIRKNAVKAERIEPFAEWDSVFLPYAVESWNRVSVMDADGNFREPVKLHINSYIEFRTRPRTDNIDHSLVEVQLIT